MAAPPTAQNEPTMGADGRWMALAGAGAAGHLRLESRAVEPGDRVLWTSGDDTRRGGGDIAFHAGARLTVWRRRFGSWGWMATCPGEVDSAPRSVAGRERTRKAAKEAAVRAASQWAAGHGGAR